MDEKFKGRWRNYFHELYGDTMEDMRANMPDVEMRPPQSSDQEQSKFL